MALVINQVIEVEKQTDSASPSSYCSYWLLPDNVSDHYCGCASNHFNPCGPCDQQHLIWKVLRFLKVIAFKVGRSYYALPLTLLAATLLVGLALGFFMGRRYEKSKAIAAANFVLKKPKKKTHHTVQNKSMRWSLLLLLSSPSVSFLSIIGDWLCAKLAAAFNICRATLSKIVYCDDNDNEAQLSRKLQEQKDQATKERLTANNDDESRRESGLTDEQLPRHVAVIMDGNRRYGISQCNGNAMAGHHDGSRKLVQFAKWCWAEHIQELTVYAFSTENWQREAHEIASLMEIIGRHCAELQHEAVQRDICVKILSTDNDDDDDNSNRIPKHIRTALVNLEHATRHCRSMQMNICLSYGSREEIVRACQQVAEDYKSNRINAVTPVTFSQHLSIQSAPDVLIRTSGEYRLSNFLLWQMAYTELFFLPTQWPAITKSDLLHVLRSYANNRQRRFGK
jgi:undecaprenyl diphosphate synthase